MTDITISSKMKQSQQLLIDPTFITSLLLMSRIVKYYTSFFFKLIVFQDDTIINLQELCHILS